VTKLSSVANRCKRTLFPSAQDYNKLLILPRDWHLDRIRDIVFDEDNNIILSLTERANSGNLETMGTLEM